MKVNDILYTSGGYEQTNVNFYKVVRRTKASIELMQIGKSETGKTECNGHWVEVMPNENVSSHNVFMRRYKDGQTYVKVHNYYGGMAYLWNGKPQLETNKLFGH
jgi:hypothetical protein